MKILYHLTVLLMMWTSCSANIAYVCTEEIKLKYEGLEFDVDLEVLKNQSTQLKPQNIASTSSIIQPQNIASTSSIRQPQDIASTSSNRQPQNNVATSSNRQPQHSPVRESEKPMTYTSQTAVLQPVVRTSEPQMNSSVARTDTTNNRTEPGYVVRSNPHTPELNSVIGNNEGSKKKVVKQDKGKAKSKPKSKPKTELKTKSITNSNSKDIKKSNPSQMRFSTKQPRKKPPRNLEIENSVQRFQNAINRLPSFQRRLLKGLFSKNPEDKTISRSLAQVTDTPIFKSITANFAFEQTLSYYSGDGVMIYGYIVRIDKKYKLVQQSLDSELDSSGRFKSDPNLRTVNKNITRFKKIYTFVEIINKLFNVSFKETVGNPSIINNAFTVIGKEIEGFNLLGPDTTNRYMSDIMKKMMRGLKNIQAHVDNMYDMKDKFVQDSQIYENKIGFKIDYNNYKCFLNASKFNKNRISAVITHVDYKFESGFNKGNDLEIMVDDREFSFEADHSYDLRKSSVVIRNEINDSNERNLRWCREWRNTNSVVIQDYRLGCDNSENGDINLYITVVVKESDSLI